MSITLMILRHLENHSLEQILENFRDEYNANFNFNFVKVFREPKNSTKYLNPVRNLMNDLLTFVIRAEFEPSNSGYIELSLIRITSRIDSNPFDLDPFEPLASRILTYATDIKVWKSLSQLVDEPESIFASQDEKVENVAAESIHRRAGTTQACTEQKVIALKKLLRMELHGSVFVNVQGFWKKYFTNKSWEGRCIDLAKEFVKQSAEKDLKFPETPTKKLVFKWMKTVEKKIFESSSEPCDITPTASSSKSKGKKHHLDKIQFRTTKASEFDGGQSVGQVDYFIKRRGLPISKRHHWHDVLVVGEFTESTTDVFMDKFLQLSLLMRELFFAQPLRRFAHAFHLFKKSLLLWVYDRSGSYCGSYIDIGKSPKTLVYVMAAYMSMSDEELGLDPNIKYEAHQITVTLDVPGPEKKRDFKLSPKTFVKQPSSISRGTSCYHTLKGDCAVKFSWRMCGDNSEAELLKIAKDVEGVASYEGSRDFVKISDLRKGLIFTDKMMKDTLPDDTAIATPLLLTDGTMLRKSKSESIAGARKRKSGASGSGTETGRSSKRSKTSYGSSISRNTVTEGTPTVSFNAIMEEDDHAVPVEWIQNKMESSLRANPESTGEKWKSTENDEVSGQVKRLHLSNRIGEISSVNNPGTSPVSGQDENVNDAPYIAGEGDVEVETNNANDYFEVAVKFAEIRDRHSSAVATKPFGRSINKVESPLGLVTVLRDAIKAHWSLMSKTKILQRDISANNIIMTGSEAHKDWKGYIIDLDLAVFTDRRAQKKRQALTGTMEFIALEVLSGSCETTDNIVEHSYRHDLESFFYVLLWQCLSRGWDNDENQNEEYLSYWYKGIVDDIYDFKRGEMVESSFVEEFLPRFSLKFQSLCSLATEFRRIVFWPHGVFSGGSPMDNNALFTATMKVFDEAICLLTI